MIVAIGTDIIAIERIQRAMEHPEFIHRILTPAEQTRDLTSQYVAGRWAAKEAVKKCLPAISSWHDVEITGEPGAAPTVKITPNVMPTNQFIHISISHETTYATAIAILEQGG